MSLRKPSIEELRKAAEAHHMRLTDQELAAYRDLMDKECDLLLMPTTPMKATPLPPVDAPRGLVIQRALEVLPNTCPFVAPGDHEDELLTLR